MNIEFVSSIAAIGEANWQQCFSSDNPFTSYCWLHALEESGCVSTATGWQPCHLTINQSNAADMPESAQLNNKCKFIGLMPGYIKSHSYGEYVFDFEWARAYQSYGLKYYPKWVSSVPFTPSVGIRLGSSATTASVITPVTSPAKGEKIAEFLNELADKKELSSWHILMSKEGTLPATLEHRAIPRLGVQYHWFNREYADFDDFLSRLKPGRRKKIRQERKRVAKQQIELQWLVGDEAEYFLASQFRQFYAQTYLKRSGHKGYLNASFFQLVAKNMRGRYAICVARKALNGQSVTIAAALYFYDQSALYGRYWGAIEDFDCLHFEVCYYQGIEFAINNQLKRFDAGAQGEHKLKRGFEPVYTHSYSHLRDLRFRRPIAEFCEQENSYMQQWFAQAKLESAFK